MTKTICLSLAAAVIASGCGKRVPEPSGMAPGTPYVTWIIMSGDRDNPDQDFVCQSAPRSDCAVSASKPAAQVFGKVYFYYHGAGSETRYEGPIEIGFFQGDRASHTTKSNIAVKKNESITNQSVTGIVTSTPGTYSVTIDVSGRVVETGRTEVIRESISVVVR
ncbi:MAG TPA: hypothetical protein VKH42_15285 [Vicinamibacterales bacterium]|nr:hypothetical protein [Vicinamibacterales bacterium]